MLLDSPIDLDPLLLSLCRDNVMTFFEHEGGPITDDLHRHFLSIFELLKIPKNRSDLEDGLNATPPLV